MRGFVITVAVVMCGLLTMGTAAAAAATDTPTVVGAVNNGSPLTSTGSKSLALHDARACQVYAASSSKSFGSVRVRVNDAVVGGDGFGSVKATGVIKGLPAGSYDLSVAKIELDDNTAIIGCGGKPYPFEVKKWQQRCGKIASATQSLFPGLHLVRVLVVVHDAPFQTSVAASKLIWVNIRDASASA